MADAYEVTTMLGRTEVRAGRIYRTRTSGSFEYDSDYLRKREAFALAPGLGLHPGPQPLQPVNPFGDSAPDTWGRKVQNRAAGRRLDELTLMFGVNDEGRQGATRFWEDGIAIASGEGVPVEAELTEIIRVADQVERGDTDIDDMAVRRLFRATGSLGGARPKANVRIGADLWLAKFPKPVGDDWNVMAWEAAMYEAMDAVGIDVASHETRRIVVDGTARTVLFLRRFDRADAVTRIPYISAMTALEATDGEGGDWLDLVDFAQVSGANTTELWRRAAFGALVGNLDDHLRNHGFLRRSVSWKLAPAFDVNPEPLGEGDTHQLALFGNQELTLESFMTGDALRLFQMKEPVAHSFLKRAESVLKSLPRRAEHHGADARSIAVMQSRFDAAIHALS